MVIDWYLPEKELMKVQRKHSLLRLTILNYKAGTIYFMTNDSHISCFLNLSQDSISPSVSLVAAE